MKLGDRVRLKDDISIFNLGSFPAGATGKVIWECPDAAEGNPIFDVDMEDFFLELEGWENVLQVFREGEVTPDLWEVVS